MALPPHPHLAGHGPTRTDTDAPEACTAARVLAERGPLPPAEALAVARQVALGLRFASALHAGHGGLALENVLLADDGAARVAGVGRALGNGLEPRDDIRALGRVVRELAGDPADGPVAGLAGRWESDAPRPASWDDAIGELDAAARELAGGKKAVGVPVGWLLAAAGVLVLFVVFAVTLGRR